MRTDAEAEIGGGIRIALEKRQRRPRPLTTTDRQVFAALVAHVGPGVALGAREIFDGPLQGTLRDYGIKDATAFGRRLLRLSRHDLGLVQIDRDGDPAWQLAVRKGTGQSRGRARNGGRRSAGARG